MLGPGFRPATPSVPPNHALAFTAVISIEPHGSGTRYRAHVMHPDPEARRSHEEMGFHDGWGTALDQLVAMLRAELRPSPAAADQLRVSGLARSRKRSMSSAVL